MYTHSIERRRPSGFRTSGLAAALLFVAACGASSTPAPTSPAAPAQAAAAPTATPTVDAGPLFTQAIARLTGLTSYRLAVALDGQGVTAAEGASGGRARMTGTVVLKPVKALRLDLAASSTGAEATGSQLTYVLIGDRAWVGTGGVLTEVPAGSAADMSGSFDAFLPETLFGTNFVDYASGYRLVGEEQKNGVACRHFQADASVLEQYAALHGVTGDWQADVWVATDGGFPVSWTVEGSAAAGSASGTYRMSVDLTGINDPANQVKPPA